MDSNILDKYAPRLSKQQYEQKVAGLYENAAEGQPSASQPDIGQALKKREFDLTIDYRLGVNFPGEKRKSLWEAKQEAEGQRFRLGLRFIKKSIMKKEFADGMQILLERTAKEFSKVLTPQELRAFMELEEGEKPVLAIDPDKL